MAEVLGRPAGNKGVLPDGTDANNLNNSGVYYTTATLTYDNLPVSMYGCLIVINFGNGFEDVLQLYIGYLTGNRNIYMRGSGRKGSSWNGWVCFNSNSI